MLGQTQIPESVKQLYRTDGWTAYMQSIFKLVQANGVSQEQIKEAIQNIPHTPGMESLLDSLHKRGDCEVIIISDSNSVFISDWLQNASADHIVSKTFTNPAWYDEEGQLQIKMYHEQDWCTLSTRNLCKGHILQSFLDERAQQGVRFDCIGYVGDGTHDLCPCLKLSSTDLAFVREGYSLAKKIQIETHHKLNAKLHIWETGHDILKTVNDFLPLI
ncbi:hypothetical protein B566_EDAN015898 [Ephemera danica]|nr:hypothetical protein B566_EDAN015898 [Ephemera danica]